MQALLIVDKSCVFALQNHQSNASTKFPSRGFRTTPIWYCMLVAGIPHLDSKSSGTSTKSSLRYLSLQHELLLSLQLEPLHVEWRQLHTFHHNLPCCWDSFASPSLPAQYRRQIYLSIGSTMLNTINKATESNARQFSLFQLVLYSTQPQISEDKNDHTVDICRHL